MSFKTALQTVMLAVLCIFIYGCIEIEYSMDIRQDGLEIARESIIVPANLAGAMTGSIETDMQKRGLEVSKKTVEDKCYVTGKYPASRKTWLFPVPKDIVQEGSLKVERSYVNLIFVKKYAIHFAYTIDKEKLGNKSNEYGKGLLDAIKIPIRYVISMPGKVSEHNAEAIVKGKLVWNYYLRPDEKIDIQVSSYIINYPLIIIAVVILAVIIVIIILRRIN